MKKEIHINSRRQLRLFPRSSFVDYFKIRVLVGDFYETMAQAYFGGERKVRKDITDLEELSCEPDIENHERKTYFEVKASKSSNYFKLFDRQIERYKILLKDESSWAHPKIDFAFFTYNLKQVLKECPNEDILIKSLAEKTSSMLILPFSITEKIWKESKKHCGNLSIYPSFSYFDRRDVNLFLGNSDEAFKKFDIAKTDYKISKSTFPDNWEIEGFKINAFPILNIGHKL